MAQSYIIMFYLITFVVIQIASQTVYVDIDTGKVLGVSQGQGQQQQRPQAQYPQGTNDWYHRRRHHWQQPNVNNQLPYVQQTTNLNANNVNAEWVCRNSKGDTMIIASEIKSRLPEQTQRESTDTYSPNADNPWLGTIVQQSEQNNPVPLPTEAPIILTTTSSTKSPFPTLDTIDWTKYLEATTKKSKAQSLNSAIDGEGILMARNGNENTDHFERTMN